MTKNKHNTILTRQFTFSNDRIWNSFFKSATIKLTLGTFGRFVNFVISLFAPPFLGLLALFPLCSLFLSSLFSFSFSLVCACVCARTFVIRLFFVLLLFFFFHFKLIMIVIYRFGLSIRRKRRDVVVDRSVHIDALVVESCWIKFLSKTWTLFVPLF